MMQHANVTQLDHYWYVVHYDKDRLEQTINDVMMVADLTREGARELLTHDMQPSQRMAIKKKSRTS